MGARLNTRDRAQTLAALAERRFDVLVIGGGISGAGVAREAARRGLSVALVEANDYAAGTSSRSSKLIHGGLRYLARAEIDLVRKTARERKAVHALAPHLAEPRVMVLSAGNRMRYLALKAAVATYDRLGNVDPRDAHETWRRKQLAHHEPLFRDDKFPLAVAYREYLADDARLVLANLRAAAAHGAVLANRLRVVSLVRTSDGMATGVLARCELTDSEFAISGKIVVNAAGPWLDTILRLEQAERAPTLTLTKGIHVVIPRAHLPIEKMWVMNARDNRPLFAIPRGPIVYLGTTDTEHHQGPELWPRITNSDVDYLIEAVPRHFRVDPLSRGHVVAAWAGLRALVAEPGKRPSEVSRQDSVVTGPSGMIAVAGGKLTGYRTVAHDVLDEIGDRLGTATKAREEDRALPGGDFDGDLRALAARTRARHGFDENTSMRLARLYGSEIEDVLALGATPIAESVPVVTGEIEWAISMEGATSLEDVFYRRTRHALYDPSGSLALRPLGRLMGERMGWDDARVAEEIASVERRFAQDLNFQDGPGPSADEDYDQVLA